MGKRKFDLSAMMDTVSNLASPQSGDSRLSRPEGGPRLDTNPGPEVKMIPLDDILTNKANFYKVDKASLKPLADSIAMDGLQQYPVVMPHPDRAGKYLLLSGHRRCAAVRQLVEEGVWDVIGYSPNDRPGGASTALVPCTVKQYQSEAMAELQLILANSTARVLTNAEISKQAERMEILLYQLKEEGYEFPGRMRDQVAAACKVSAPKLARLKVIREKLKAPEFLLLFEKDKLPEQTAYALARLPEEFQKRLAGISVDLSGNTAELILRKYEAGWRWEPDMKCPDGKACRRGDAFLRHDLGCCAYEMCGGKTCCLNCSRAKESYSPCDRMCSKAQALRKEQRDEKKAAAEKQAREMTKRCQKETAANARRVLLAAEAAGLSEKKHIAWGYDDATVEQLRAYASGVFPEGEWWYSAKFSPGKLTDPAKTAKLLGCSADYLLGLTDDLTPAAAGGSDDGPRGTSLPVCDRQRPSRQCREAPLPVWLPGKPEKSGPVVARFFFPDGGLNMTRLCWYDAEFEKYRFGEDSAPINVECTGWWPVPEMEEDSNADDQ